MSSHLPRHRRLVRHGGNVLQDHHEVVTKKAVGTDRLHMRSEAALCLRRQLLLRPIRVKHLLNAALQPQPARH